MNILLFFWNVIFILWLMALQWITIRLGWYKFMCKDDPRNPVKTHINSLAEKHFSLETYFKILTTGTNSVCIWNRYFENCFREYLPFWNYCTIPARCNLWQTLQLPFQTIQLCSSSRRQKGECKSSVHLYNYVFL